MKNNKKVIIIGAGPAGLSCAYELQKHNIKVELYESSKHIGGMSRSFDLWGQKVDLGPHRFFSKDEKVNHFFQSVINKEYTIVNRKTRIYYKNRFFEYPLKLGNIIKSLPLTSIIKVLLDYSRQRINPIKKPTTFEDWVINRFGKSLYQMFFKSYSEKLWGIPCKRIDVDWAAQRIKSLSLINAVTASIIGSKKSKHQTLIDQFAYPKNGAGALYEKCAESILKNGGEIHLEQAVKKVMIDQNSTAKGVLLENGTIVFADAVVSTMPVTQLTLGIKNLPNEVLKASEQLYYRNTILAYIEVNQTGLFEDNWLYIHSPQVKHGRITNFRNWCPSLHNNINTTILCMEIWAFDTDEIWHLDDHKLSNIAMDELLELKLIPDSASMLRTHILKVPKSYPVYETGYKKHLSILENYLNKIENLYPIGRYGAFKYNNQDHSVLMGILSAQKIIKNDNTNLWSINTDTEYQEEGNIKKDITQS